MRVFPADWFFASTKRTPRSCHVTKLRNSAKNLDHADQGVTFVVDVTETHPEQRLIGNPRVSPCGQRFESLRSFALLAAAVGHEGPLQPRQRSRAMSPWGSLQQINRLPAAGGSTGSGW
jgi:hypothetical protein